MNTKGEASIISVENITQHTFPFIAFLLFPWRLLLWQQLQVRPHVIQRSEHENAIETYIYNM